MNNTHPYLSNKHTVFLMLGVFLCAYFMYHSFQGSRSYPTLVSLDKSIEAVQADLDTTIAQRQKLERQVVMMRPGSVNSDLLEERVRVVLGYKSPNEFVILNQ
jgi:cell division protein FtsB